MESLRELYRIGRGPSSSHTMGPGLAAARFKNKYADADRFTAVLFGSLSKTGKGHLTDQAIRDAFSPLPAVQLIALNDFIRLPTHLIFKTPVPFDAVGRKFIRGG